MSLLAPLLRPHTRQSATKISTQCMGNWIANRQDGHQKHHTQRAPGRGDHSHRARDDERGEFKWEDAFIRGLMEAGTCRKHRKVTTSRSRTYERHFTTGRPYKSATVTAPDEDADKVSRQDYQDLVDIYPAFSPAKTNEQGVVVEKKREHIPLAPRLVITPEQELLPRSKRILLPPEDASHAQQLKAFAKLTQHRYGRLNLENLWRRYGELRSPRPRYLADSIISRLFKHLGWVKNWYQPNAMQRYFSFLNDCLGEGVHVTGNQWTTAVALAGRSMRYLTATEIRRAIETWMQMERHGHEADHVIFNILLDVAVKAGRFALADTIYNELMVRKLPLDRWARGSLIYYAGVRRDGDSVRKSFKEFVEAGEIVDTTIMNAVLVSLLRAGEPSAAEHVFERMKRLHRDKFCTKSLDDWRDTKEMKLLLNKTAKQLRKEKEEHETSFFGAPFSSDHKRDEIQKATPIAPDARTYAILIKYHSSVSGDIDRIWDLWSEMREHGFCIHGSTYVHLLRGFHAHGGYPFSAWNHRRLEEIWQEIVNVCTPTTFAHNVDATEQPFHTADQTNGSATADKRSNEDYEALDYAQYGGDEDHEPPPELNTKEAAADEESFDMLGAMLAGHSHVPTELRTNDLQANPNADAGSESQGSGDGQSDSSSTSESHGLGVKDTSSISSAPPSSTFQPLEVEQSDSHPTPKAATSDEDLFSSSTGFGPFELGGEEGAQASTESGFNASQNPQTSSSVGTDNTSGPSNDEDSASQPMFEQDRGPHMTTGFGIVAIRAFYHCTGRKRMLAVWEDMKARWMGEPDIDWTRIEREVEKCNVDADKYVGASEDGPYQHRRSV